MPDRPNAPSSRPNRPKSDSGKKSGKRSRSSGDSPRVRVEEVEAERTSSRRRSRKTKKKDNTPLLVMGGLGGIAVVAAVLVMVVMFSSSKVEEKPKDQQKPNPYVNKQVKDPFNAPSLMDWHGLKKWDSKSAVKQKLTASVGAKKASPASIQQDALSGGEKWIYGRGDPFGTDFTGIMLYFNYEGELVMILQKGDKPF